MSFQGLGVTSTDIVSVIVFATHKFEILCVRCTREWIKRNKLKDFIGILKWFFFLYIAAHDENS